MSRILLVVALALARDLWVALPARAETLEAAWAQSLVSNSQLAAAEFRPLRGSVRRGDCPDRTTSVSPDPRFLFRARSDERSFRIDNPLLGGQTFAAPYEQRDAAGAVASVNVPIYAGGRIENSILGAEARLAAADQSVSATRLD